MLKFDRRITYIVWTTESCEQGFKGLKQYFHLTRMIAQFKRNVLFWFVYKCLSADLEAELRRKKLL